MPNRRQVARVQSEHDGDPIAVIVADYRSLGLPYSDIAAIFGIHRTTLHTWCDHFHCLDGRTLQPAEMPRRRLNLSELAGAHGYASWHDAIYDLRITRALTKPQAAAVLGISVTTLTTYTPAELRGHANLNTPARWAANRRNLSKANAARLGDKRRRGITFGRALLQEAARE